MKAMILSAGRGERLRPLTDSIPKPLLKVGPYTLLEHHLISLAKRGIKDFVINVSYRGEQVISALGDGRDYGVKIQYSSEDTALETGGGIVTALPLLGEEPFWVINGDVLTNYDFAATLADDKLAHLLLVKNPSHNPKGDFSLARGLVSNRKHHTYTFSGLGLYRPQFFAGYTAGERFALAPIIRQQLNRQVVSGELFSGQWLDVGTKERFAQARRIVADRE